VLEFPDSASLMAALVDPRFVPAAIVSALAGAVRGFSGFGSALIYIPLVAAIYDPRVAAVTLLLVDFVSSAPFSISSFRRCNWREVLPVSIGMAAALPLGALILLMVDPIALRWGIAALVITLLAALASGWRYHGNPATSASLAVGAVAGFGAGAVQIAGPPVILYWLGGPGKAAVVRANLMVFFALSDIVALIVYGSQGLITRDAVTLSLLLGAPFLAAMTLGALTFRGASDATYRRAAYALIALAALASLPIFDRFLR
jgi:uncharacterized membrane protein YfcA